MGFAFVFVEGMRREMGIMYACVVERSKMK